MDLRTAAEKREENMSENDVLSALHRSISNLSLAILYVDDCDEFPTAVIMAMNLAFDILSGAILLLRGHKELG